MNFTCTDNDIELLSLIEKENERQNEGLELIASENIVDGDLYVPLGSCLTNKYSEGYPGRRYYGGNEYIDKIEELCQQRALDLYGLDPEEWCVNVQPYSGSGANFAVYTAVLGPGGKFIGLDLPCGGHLTHGFQTKTTKVSATSLFFDSRAYHTDPDSGLVDYDEIRQLVKEFQPQLIVAGASAYPRDWDYETLRGIADEAGILLMMDMSHIGGLVASKLLNNPFDYCHIVTTTTHKTLRGPRAGMIFCRKMLQPKIDKAVFPGLQGGPHNNTIAAIAMALKKANTDEFRAYSAQVIRNAKRLGHYLMTRYGYMVCTLGTDTHLLLIDLRPQGVSGSNMEHICDLCNITLNKNTVPGDKSALHPGGIRIGTPAVTTRGMGEDDMDVIGEFLHSLILFSHKVGGSQPLNAFKARCANPENAKKISEIRASVKEFVSRYRKVD